jgi:putative pyruvate formate lyase activating enzyme
MLAKVFEDFDALPVNNINLVTPSHFIDEIIEAFKIYKPHKPVVYNSSGYDDIDALKRIDKYIDIYLVDLKYFDSNLSMQLSKAKDYFKVASKAIDFMLKQKSEDKFDGEIMTSGVIIRHLVLPGNTSDSLKVLDYLKSTGAQNRYISLMGQYTPCYNASGDLKRPLKKLEYTRVISYFNKLGFTKGFCQDLSSSSTDFIPDF